MATNPLHADEDHHHRHDREPRAVPNLGVEHDDEDESRRDGTDEVDGSRQEHATSFGASRSLQQLVPVPDHARLAQRERREHADDVELDELVDVRVEADDQRDGQATEDQDAVAEDELVAAVVQLTGQEARLRQDRGQHRKAVERRVRGEDEDAGCRGLVEVEEKGVRAEDAGCDLRDDRRVAVRQRVSLHSQCQRGDTDEHADCQQAHDAERRRRISRLGLAECGHTVADRFHAGERRTS